MLKPFLVTGLPRSRTAWLAAFLTEGDRACHHEPSFRWIGDGDLAAWLGGDIGASDTQMCWLAHEIRKRDAEVPLVLIRRPRRDVLTSLAKLDYPKAAWLPAWLERIDHRLDRIEDDLHCLSFSFDSLHEQHVCAAIFRHCLGRDPPVGWWERWRGVNVQSDVKATVRLIHENESGWMKVYLPRYREVV